MAKNFTRTEGCKVIYTKSVNKNSIYSSKQIFDHCSLENSLPHASSEPLISDSPKLVSGYKGGDPNSLKPKNTNKIELPNLSSLSFEPTQIKLNTLFKQVCKTLFRQVAFPI